MSGFFQSYTFFKGIKNVSPYILPFIFTTSKRTPLDFIPPAEVSGKIMTLIDQAKTELILVSPFNKIARWYKLTQRIETALSRGVHIQWYVREGIEDNDLDRIEALGIEPIPIKNLHAKLYMNDSHAVMTSMNLHIFSDSSSIDIGYWIHEEDKLEELRNFLSTHLAIPEKEEKSYYDLLQLYLSKYNSYYQELTTRKSRYGISTKLNAFLKKFDLIVEPKGSYIRIDLRTTGRRTEKKEQYTFVKDHLQELEKLSGLKVHLGTQMLRFKIDLQLHASYTYTEWGYREFEILREPLEKWVDSCIRLLSDNKGIGALIEVDT